jgi:hypothetical protein
LKHSRASIAGPLATQSISILNVQPQRFLHLVEQLHRELCVVPGAPTFLNRSTLMLDEALPFGNMSLGFYEMLREASSGAVHNVSPELRECSKTRARQR